MAGTRRQIGPYVLEQLVGRGGMGEVYRAFDERLGRLVAIKCLRSDRDGAPHMQARLRREARALAQLHHPSVVQIFDVLQFPEGDWIVMELVDGPSLRQAIEDRPLSLEKVLEYGHQIALGLDAAHRRGILHRDLKTDNVLLHRPADVGHSTEQVKIVDFGLARWRGTDSLSLSNPSISWSGQVFGTPRSMSPEQAQGADVTVSSDLFSLGVLLYELLSGHSPFAGRTLAETFRRLSTHHPPSLRRFRPRIPLELEELIDRLLDKAPDRRPTDAQEVAEALWRISDSRRSKGPVDGSTAPAARRPNPPRPLTGAAPELRQWSEPELPPEPYPVLLPYSHHALMAGREAEVQQLRRALRMSIPMLGLSAPSGTGKSSLLTAGLIPTLRRQGQPIALVRHPTEPGLARRLLGDLFREVPDVEDRNPSRFLDYLSQIPEGQTPILVLDQLEDLFKSVPETSSPKEHVREPHREGIREPRPRHARAVLGQLLAATIAHRPGTIDAPCRWLLVYRQELHGRLVLWLRDVLEEARALATFDVDGLPYDLSAPERFHSMALRPLGTPSHGGSPLDDATETFLSIIEKPLRVAGHNGRPLYPHRFAPGEARRLARSFAQARIDRPEAPLVPELQVVLAHLLTSQDPMSPIMVGEDPEGLIKEALENHLRRALDHLFPSHSPVAREHRTRTLLALRELATSTGRRSMGVDAQELSRMIGQRGPEVLEALARPLSRLVMLRETPGGLRCVLTHDALAAVVVRLVEEESRHGHLLIDDQLLALRRLVGLKTLLFQRRSNADEGSATRLSHRHHRSISDHRDVLLCDAPRRDWWAACQRRRLVERRHRVLALGTLTLLLVLWTWGATSWARQRADHRALLEQVARGEPEAALRAVVTLQRRDDAPQEDLLPLLRQRQVEMDILELGLSGLGEESLGPPVLSIAELSMPWVEQEPHNATLIANLVWALDYVAATEPAYRRRAEEMRRTILAPLRRLRPPPPTPPLEDRDWVEIPGGTYWMGTPVDDPGRDEERPPHQVTLSPFRLLRHEVTNAQYRRLFPHHEGADDKPAVLLMWYEAYTYAAWLGGRLPTEAEWEYAARAGCPHAYCSRDGRPTTLGEVGWTAANSQDPERGDFELRRVMGREPNPWGLFDMVGNAAEWTADPTYDYTAAPRSNPWFRHDPQQRTRKRLRRGGNFLTATRNARVGKRDDEPPQNYDNLTGFRVVTSSSLHQ